MPHSSVSSMDEILALVLPKLSGWRRDLHAHPEACWREFRTASLILAHLDQLGFTICMGRKACADPRMGVPSPSVLAAERQRALAEGADPAWVERMGDGYTGFWADLDCGPGPSVAFRFDMDCNDVSESTDGDHRPRREGFASCHPGLMHACGHDGHAAVGMGLAEVLAALRPRLCGRIRLVFQPAEEGGRGALPMAEAGAVDGMDRLFGFHLGFRADRPGMLICGTQQFLATTKRDVVFSGKAAHAGAAPEEGKDALLAASAAVLGLHAIARNGHGGTRIAVGRLDGGTVRNVIAEAASLSMETRGETSELDAYMVAESERVLRAAADMWGCTCSWTNVGMAAGGSSSPELAELVAETAGEMAVWDNIVPLDAFGASEDFTWLMNRVQEAGGQAAYMQVGTARAAGHHSGRFDFDESALGRALELLVRLALRCAGGIPAEGNMPFLDRAVQNRRVHLHLWLEGEDGEGFGQGRIALLQLVDELGSLSKAAKQLGMSYRGAWGKIRKMEQIVGESLVDASGIKRDGSSLTPAGHELVRRFRQWYDEVDSFAHERAEALFSNFSGK